MEGAAATNAGAGATDWASLMVKALQRMLGRGYFVVCNEELGDKPLLFMTPRLLHALVAEECYKAHGVYSTDEAVKEAVKAAFLGALEPRGVGFVSSLYHDVKGRENDVLINVRPACVPVSWYQHKYEDLPAALKQSALLTETVRAVGFHSSLRDLLGRMLVSCRSPQCRHTPPHAETGVRAHGSPLNLQRRPQAQHLFPPGLAAPR